MTDTQNEAHEIIENAQAQYRLGNISRDDLLGAWRRAGMDAELESAALELNTHSGRNILPQPPQVHDLINQIQNHSPSLSYRQRDDLLLLVQQGKADAAADLLAAWTGEAK